MIEVNVLTKIWGYKPDSEHRLDIKSKAISAMIFFLALMICFTIISKVTDSMTVPIVETEKPIPSTINHTVTVDGVLETTNDSGVVVTEGAIVKEVNIKEGDNVSEGDLLFTYDISDFNLQIAQYETQLGKINANLKESQSRNVLEEQNRGIANERAQQDLEVTGIHSDLDVLLAEENVKAADEKVRVSKEALNRYEGINRKNDNNYYDSNYSSDEYHRLLSEHTQAQYDYDEALAAQKNYEETATTFGDDSETSEQTSEAAEDYLNNSAINEQVRETREKLQQAKDDLDKYDGIFGHDNQSISKEEYSKEEHNRLDSEYRQSLIAYDEAVLQYKKVVAEKEKSILDAQRTIEDTEKSQATDATAEIARMDAKSINLKLSELYETVKNNGQVYAPISGVITKVMVGAGTRTNNEAAIFINNAETMNFITEVSKDEKKYVNIGNNVKIKMAGETKDIQDLQIDSIQPSETNGLFKVTITMPAEYLPGTSGTAEIQQKSKSYETVVPLSALHNDASQFFVLKVTETQTSMGTEYFSQRIDVTLVEKNETYAAVTGAINNTDKIIISSKRLIQDGDRIRVPIEE